MPTFRSFAETDLDACVSLFLSVFTVPPWNDGWSSSDHAKTYLLEFVRNPGFQAWVAEDGGRIIGLCFGHLRTWWMGRELYIDEMCVDLPLHRTGVGSAFLQHVKAEVRAQGARAITLLTDRGTPAEAFYVKNGFERHDRMVFMACGTEP